MLFCAESTQRIAAVIKSYLFHTIAALGRPGTMSTIKLIVAACDGLGIGHKGELPWRLRNEMKYFSAMTRMTNNQDRQNAVIMGRKTWKSIPEKNRPLFNRINVVLSRNQKEIPGAHYTCQSFQEALDLLNSDELNEKVENIWIIGGHEIYKIAIESGKCDRIYLTRIMKSFECDVFFPDIFKENYRIITDSNVPIEIQKENEIEYKYEVYEKLPM